MGHFIEIKRVGEGKGERKKGRERDADRKRGRRVDTGLMHSRDLKRRGQVDLDANTYTVVSSHNNPRNLFSPLYRLGSRVVKHI